MAGMTTQAVQAMTTTAQAASTVAQTAATSTQASKQVEWVTAVTMAVGVWEQGVMTTAQVDRVAGVVVTPMALLVNMVVQTAATTNQAQMLVAWVETVTTAQADKVWAVAPAVAMTWDQATLAMIKAAAATMGLVVLGGMTRGVVWGVRALGLAVAAACLVVAVACLEVAAAMMRAVGWVRVEGMMIRAGGCAVKVGVTMGAAQTATTQVHGNASALH